MMTAVEAYDLTTQGGAADFARLVAACESFGPYCLISCLAQEIPRSAESGQTNGRPASG
jgi:hypothetical protein